MRRNEYNEFRTHLSGREHACAELRAGETERKREARGAPPRPRRRRGEAKRGEAGKKKNLRGNVRGASKSGIYVLINVKPIAIAFMQFKLPATHKFPFCSACATAECAPRDTGASDTRDVLPMSTRKHSLQLHETNVTAAEFVATISRVNASFSSNGVLHYVKLMGGLADCSPFFITRSFFALF